MLGSFQRHAVYLTSRTVLVGAALYAHTRIEGSSGSNDASQQTPLLVSSLKGNFLAQCARPDDDLWLNARPWAGKEAAIAKEKAILAARARATAGGEGEGNIDTNASSMAEEGDDDDDIDMSPAESCGFCSYFLNSPCKRPFHYWRLCVEAKKEAGEDFAEGCLDHTKALALCVDANKMDFSGPDDDGDDEEADAGVADNDVATDADGAEATSDEGNDEST